ncbi:hypothetical protein GTA08_BOTSDO02862 [Neofusicoccum parvum]|nr:hypothetical protein GTA08_BOTSDO02862 [Neofusicoccum parvum]
MAGYADLPPAYETLEPRDALDPYMAAVKSSQLSEDPLPVPAETIQQYLAAAYWLQEQIYSNINTYHQPTADLSSHGVPHEHRSPDEAFDRLPLEKQQIILQIVEELPPEELEHISSSLPLRPEVTTQRHDHHSIYEDDSEDFDHSLYGVSAQSESSTHVSHKSKHTHTHKHKHKHRRKHKHRHSKSHEEAPEPRPDDLTTSKVTRFFGDTLMGRMARAGVGTTTSAIKNFRTLSPWGDNNPVIVPNVRYRDAILFAAFSAAGGPMVEGIDTLIHDAFGSDNFIAEVVSTGADAIKESMAVKLAVFQVVEQAIDVGILEHLMPEEDKLITTGSVKTLRVQVRHKLMGVDADLQFKGQYLARDPGACAKGWFCPYLFASGRTPEIPRSHDFAMAEFWGPFIKSDECLARALLSASPSVLSLCDPDPTHAFPAPRMLLLFTAIAPFRAGMWSTSRRPGCATMFFHLFDGCPALVVPVKPAAAASPPPLSRSSTATSSSSSSSKGKQRAHSPTNVPVLAWSPWTLAQMMGPGRDGYGAAVQHRQLCEWLDGMLSVEHMHERVRGRYVELLGRSVSLVVNGGLGVGKMGEEWLKERKVDVGRAGVVAVRF